MTVENPGGMRSVASHLLLKAEGIERRGTTRDGWASPTGRELWEEIESMQEKRKEFLEKKRGRLRSVGETLSSRSLMPVLLGPVAGSKSWEGYALSPPIIACLPAAPSPSRTHSGK